MEDFIIKTRSGFDVITGYRVNKRFFCHKLSKGNWIISDYNSGLKVADSIQRCEDCWKWVRNENNINNVNEKIEKRMDLIRELISIGRNIREEAKIKVRQPVSEILIDGNNEDLISDLVPLMKEELNVKEIVFIKDLDQYMNFTVKPNFKEVGKILGSKIKEFSQKLLELTNDKISKLNNKENSFEKKINGILNNQILTFYEDKIKVKIEIQNDKVKIIRSTDEYKITMDFQKFLTIEGKYDIKNIGILDLKTKTKELIIKDNKIYIEYILYINNEDLGLNIYEIEYEAI